MKPQTLVLVVLLFISLASMPSEAGCPSNEGVVSDCAYSECTPEQCAADGLECCPKPCGGYWCVEGPPFAPAKLMEVREIYPETTCTTLLPGTMTEAGEAALFAGPGLCCDGTSERYEWTRRLTTCLRRGVRARWFFLTVTFFGGRRTVSIR
ncbi:hypothetical protein HPB50_007954 [Hyalomma asiaticum]|uniref:Uncharacterized protein n=1 Tax=Hyalomma asiaticum TaxID=266040 RepID=A0ACB7S5G9_HYAAI|nr:hypothetical protein HPB50_007954 [Hyalomma asiaticum]